MGASTLARAVTHAAATHAPPPVADATLAVLAGGRGLRLGGTRKALLRSGGEPLLARTLRALDPLFAARVVVADDPEPYRPFGVPIVPDPIPGRGAPGGLLAALRAARTPWVFLVACDMPAIDGAVVASLARHREADRPCLATIDGRPEPLHAFWPVSAEPLLARLLATGEPSFRDLLAEIGSVGVPIERLEAERAGARASFANVNRPEDLAAWGIEPPLAEDST